MKATTAIDAAFRSQRIAYSVAYLAPQIIWTGRRPSKANRLRTAGSYHILKQATGLPVWVAYGPKRVARNSPFSRQRALYRASGLSERVLRVETTLNAFSAAGEPGDVAAQDHAGVTGPMMWARICRRLHRVD